MSEALEALDIRFAYDDGPEVLCDVSLSVRPGGLVGIIGPNGCGKSTLLRIAAGLLRPGAGQVMLEDAPLSKLAPLQRARCLGFLPQQVAPAFSLSAAEVVALGRFPHASPFGPLNEEDKEAVFRSLEVTETLDLSQRSFLTLSGGERQRVLLASVLAQAPKYLLLDEPTASLDLHHAAEVFALLRRLAEDGYGIAVVTHDINLAAATCDTLLLLGHDHRAVAYGSVDEVVAETKLSEAYDSPIQVGRHPFTGLPFAAARRL